MVYCCVCGLALVGIHYPETFDLDDEEITQLYDEEKLPATQLEVCNKSEILAWLAALKSPMPI
jgi:hypothetical protein